MARHDSSNEFSRPIALKDIGERPVVRDISAKPAELQALAKRFDLLALNALSAELTLFWRGAEVVVEGHLEADAVQRCVVSLAEVPARVSSDFTLLYREDTGGQDRPEEEIDPEAPEELPEPFGPNGIDLGEAVAQQLFLALDPYPRHPDAAPPKREWGAPAPNREEAEAAANPFAVLKKLKPGR